MEARMDARNTSRTIPWYRQKWPWLLMLPPAAAVVGGFITLWLAIKTWDGLVVDDYYKEGLAIRKTMDRSLKAGELGLTAYVSIDAERLRLRFDEERAKARPPFLVSRYDKRCFCCPEEAAVLPLFSSSWICCLT